MESTPPPQTTNNNVDKKCILTGRPITTFGSIKFDNGTDGVHTIFGPVHKEAKKSYAELIEGVRLIANKAFYPIGERHDYQNIGRVMQTLADTAKDCLRSREGSKIDVQSILVACRDKSEKI